MNKYLTKIAEQQGIDEKGAFKRSLKTTATSLTSATIAGGIGATVGGIAAHKSQMVRKGLSSIGKAVKGGAMKALPKKNVRPAIRAMRKNFPTALAGGALAGHQVGEGIGDFVAIHHGTREAMKEGKDKK